MTNINQNYKSILFSHNDFPMAVRDLFKNNLTFLDFDSYLSESEPFQSYSMDHTDLKRLKAGHVGGQVSGGYDIKNDVTNL